MAPHKSKDATKLIEFDITTYTKGFVSETVNSGGGIVKEYFHFKEIYHIVHHVNVGVEIVFYNGKHRVFYNDIVGESQLLFDMVNNNMLSWMNSNLN